MLASVVTLVKRIAHPGDLPVCQIIEKEGVDKAKIFFDKLDKNVMPLNKLRNQFITFLLDAQKPDTKTTIPLFSW